MRIMLIPPLHHYPQYPAPLSFSDWPMGFAYLAAALRKAGHQVEAANVNNIPGFVDGLTMMKAVITTRLREFQPELIGLGGLCTDFLCIRDAMGIIRAQCKTPIVLGGGIVTNDAEWIFNHLKPDFAIVGEGEETLVKLANWIKDEQSCILNDLTDGTWGGVESPIVLPPGYIPNLYFWEGDSRRKKSLRK